MLIKQLGLASLQSLGSAFFLLTHTHYYTERVVSHSIVVHVSLGHPFSWPTHCIKACLQNNQLTTQELDHNIILISGKYGPTN